MEEGEMEGRKEGRKEASWRGGKRDLHALPNLPLCSRVRRSFVRALIRLSSGAAASCSLLRLSLLPLNAHAFLLLLLRLRERT